MRRALIVILALAALAVGAAGCGGSSTAAKGGFDDALGYFPKNSFVVVAIKTKLSDAQYKQLDAMIGRFPFANQIKDRIKQAISSGTGGQLAYDRDLKPALGNDVVLGIPGAAAARRSGDNFLGAWRINGGDPKKLLAGDSKVGSAGGATIYGDPKSSGFRAIKGNVLLFAPTRSLLDAALKQRTAGNRLTQAQFESNLGDLNKGALVRVEGNIQSILTSSPKSAAARKVPWVGALRTFAATTSADPDGVSVDFRVNTAGPLSGAKLPLASGPASPPVVKVAGEIGTALRNPAQIAKFAEQASATTNAKSMLKKGKVQRALGVDIDRDLIGQLGGDSAASFGLDGGFAMRADLKDPTSFTKSLATAVKNLPKAQKAAGGTAMTKAQPGPGGLYLITTRDGKREYLGVVGNRVVLATDPARAKEFAVQPASAVAGAHGALAISADPKSIADAIIKKRTIGAAALLGPALTGPLKDFTGWVDSESGGLRGHLKLTIR